MRRGYEVCSLRNKGRPFGEGEKRHQVDAIHSKLQSGPQEVLLLDGSALRVTRGVAVFGHRLFDLGDQFVVPVVEAGVLDHMRAEFMDSIEVGLGLRMVLNQRLVLGVVDLKLNLRVS